MIKTAPPVQVPDSIRVPLDSLHADAEYLLARLLAGTLTREQVVGVIRDRIDAAQLEIDGLRTRVQELGAMLRENRSRRIVELEAQLEAVGAGGVQALSQKKATLASVGKAQAAINSGADSVLEDAARLKEAVDLLEELAEHDNYSTEYDGRMLSICPECGEQDGEHRAACAFVRAKAFLAARKQGGA